MLKTEQNGTTSDIGHIMKHFKGYIVPNLFGTMHLLHKQVTEYDYDRTCGTCILATYWKYSIYDKIIHMLEDREKVPSVQLISIMICALIMLDLIHFYMVSLQK